MDCETTRKAWHDRGDDALHGVAVESHLAECMRCRAYVADMRRIAAALDQLREETETMPASAVTAPRRVVAPARFGITLRLAAMIALVAGLYVASMQFRPAATPTIATRDALQVAPPALRSVEPMEPIGITLRGHSSANLLAVAMPTGEPDVQMYWLYPKLGGSASAGLSGH